MEDIAGRDRFLAQSKWEMLVDYLPVTLLLFA